MATSGINCRGMFHTLGSTSASINDNVSLSDIVLDSGLLANDLEQAVQQLHHRRHSLIHLTRLFFVTSLVSTVVAGRVYYLLYHAPLRHAWRLREAKRRVPQYQRAMKSFSIAGIAGFLFLLSPLGFPQQMEECKAKAEVLDGLAMRCLVMKEQGKQLALVGSVNQYTKRIMEKETDFQKDEGGSSITSTNDSRSGHNTFRKPPLPPVVHVCLPRWHIEYCVEEYLAANEKKMQQKKGWWRSVVLRWSSLYSFFTSGSSTSTTTSFPMLIPDLRSLLLHPQNERIAMEWKWALDGEGKEEWKNGDGRTTCDHGRWKGFRSRYALVGGSLNDEVSESGKKGVEVHASTYELSHTFEEQRKKQEKNTHNAEGGAARENVSAPYMSSFSSPPTTSLLLHYPRKVFDELLRMTHSLCWVSKKRRMKKEEEEWRKSVLDFQSLWREGVLKPLNTIKPSRTSPSTFSSVVH